MLLHPEPPCGPKPHGTAPLPPPKPPPGGTAEMGLRVTLVRMPFSVGLGAVLLGLGATLVSAGFSLRGLHATVTEPIPRTASALSPSDILRIVLQCMLLLVSALSPRLTSG